MTTIKKDLQRLLFERDMTISDVARLLNVTPSNLHTTLRNGNPKLSTLEGIAKAIDCNLEIRFVPKK